MIGLLKALGVVKTALAVTTLTVATAFAAQTALPAAAGPGQARAAAAGANATLPDAADPASGKDVAAIQARLAANKARLLTTLEEVLARLEANPNVNDHAKAALQKVIDRLESGDFGLDRASRAVGGEGGAGSATTPTLPSQAQNHPGPDSHPGGKP